MAARFRAATPPACCSALLSSHPTVNPTHCSTRHRQQRPGRQQAAGAPDEGRGGAQAGGVVETNGEGQEGLGGLQVAEALPVKVAAHEQRSRNGDRAHPGQGAARLALMPGRAGAAAGARWLLLPTSRSSTAAAAAAAQAAAAQGWPAGLACATAELHVRAGPWRRAHGAKERPSSLSAARSRHRLSSSLPCCHAAVGVCQTGLPGTYSLSCTPEAASDMVLSRFDRVESPERKTKFGGSGARSLAPC